MSICWIVAFALCLQSPTTETPVTTKMHHLRGVGVREWVDFPQAAEGPSLQLTFPSRPNASEWNLRLRQKDVKETWRVALNGKELGRLVQDENPMSVRLAVPTGTVVEGANRLSVEQLGKNADDILVGDLA